MNYLIIIAGIFCSVVSFAEENILDFEGDVIEGTRKRPDLFLQTTNKIPSLEVIIYQRRHFNDFHRVDAKRRPLFVDQIGQFDRERRRK